MITNLFRLPFHKLFFKHFGRQMATESFWSLCDHDWLFKTRNEICACWSTNSNQNWFKPLLMLFQVGGSTIRPTLKLLLVFSFLMCEDSICF